MIYSNKQIEEWLLKNSNFKLLAKNEHALERECFRIDKNGGIAKTRHPEVLGSPLTNPHISTDFSESQLEFITPVYTSEEGTLKFLNDIHHYTITKLQDENIWPFSPPAKLPKEKDIPLAKYGSSNLAHKKEQYRIGLRARYGAIMQTISGVHYNFSFNNDFWEKMYKKFAQEGQSLQDFKTASYFKIIRNFLEISWLDIYLFGASPAVDTSYEHRGLLYFNRHGKDTYYGKYATSLRMSKYGYCCQDRPVSFSNISEYIRDLRHLTSTPKRKYFKLEGLNDHILQIPNEYYAVIRPKRNHDAESELLNILEEKGVQYIEVRTVDIDPNSPNGVSLEHLRFLHTFMLYCLMKSDREISKKRQHDYSMNQEKVALYGRKPNLQLTKDTQKTTLKSWATQILDEMKVAAEILDKNNTDNRYTKTLTKQYEKVEDPNKTPSAQILNSILQSKKSYLQFGLDLSKEHYKHLKDLKISTDQVKRFEIEAQTSLKVKERMEAISEQTTEGYENLERSTQILIKEALKRGIKVEVLNEKASFIRLRKGRKVEYVKQATKTSKDSYISYLLMEDKQISKIILNENKISVPAGGLYNTIESALEDYEKFEDKKIIIKPNTTNFGIGVSMVLPKDKKSYTDAVKFAFEKDSSVIIEEFIEGTEYRVLVIDGKALAVVERRPANVTGDGKSTISELIESKNTDFKQCKNKWEYPIKVTAIEKAKLKSQNLTLTSVPKKNKVVYLRDNTNVSTGGDAIDHTKTFPSHLKEAAVKAAKSVDATFCGVDMITNGKDYSIIEINFNPALGMHVFPSQGEGQNLAVPVLDALGF
ncbi:glutamate--cysteine ligase [Candidatus Peregrinibacteria bacterium CG10_big_fil_rev_8_21_14_0_10_36_19]|nr:MAG: glutamate--cysteine ligase [Candidatus Peregrinibacteria bacterium CG10_big_fil_rev_8_21_14_0_10_36_19]